MRTPPPYGGGEVIHASLRDHYASRGEYRILEVNSGKRDKTNQGAIRPWKIAEFLAVWFKLARELYSDRPRLFFMGIGKRFPHFVRDSLLIWAARLRGVPVMVELHGSGFTFLGRSRVMDAYGRLVLSHVKSIRVLGPSIARALEQYGINNVVSIENGICPVADRAKAQETARQNEFAVLFVGTLSEQKGVCTLIDAVERLESHVKEIRIHCMGPWISGSFEKKVVAMVTERGLGDTFIFHGPLHGDAKWGLFARCDILVLPSKTEGQPLVILEAYACGMPVVATAVGAVPDTVNDGENGFVVPPDNTDALVKALQDLIDAPGRVAEIGSHNASCFDERFSLDIFLKKHEQWLQSVTH